MSPHKNMKWEYSYLYEKLTKGYNSEKIYLIIYIYILNQIKSNQVWS